MGNTNSSYSYVTSEDLKSWEHNTIMTGLDAAGKSTILYKLRIGLDPMLSPYPNLGWTRPEKAKYKQLYMEVYDAGYQRKIEPLYSHLYKACEAFIWVVDSNVVDRLADSRDELHRILNAENMQNVIVLVFVNKRDLSSNALSVEEVQERIGMFQYRSIETVFLKSILKDIPDEILELIALYSKHRITAPCYKSVNGTQTKCKVVGCVATTGEGLREGLDWLNDTFLLTHGKMKDYCAIM